MNTSLKLTSSFFNASLDKEIFISTVSWLFFSGFLVIISLALFFFVGKSFLKNLKNKERKFRRSSWQGLLALIVVFLLGTTGSIRNIRAYFNAPCGYSINDTAIIIHKHYGDITIPVKEINKAWLDAAKFYKIDRCYRYCWIEKGWVSYEMFGTFGSFYTSKFGWLDYYVTNMNNLVVLEGKKKVVISPDHPREFIALLMSKLYSSY